MGVLWPRLFLLVFGATLAVLVAWAQDTSALWWDVYWYPTRQQGWFCPRNVQLDYSQPLGKERFPLVFVRDWDEGDVYGDKRDDIGFEAFLTVALPYPMELEFVVHVDDGAELYIDVERILDLRRWDPMNPVRQQNVRRRLASGEHNLMLRFFECTGRAYIKFDILGLDKLELAMKLARLREELTGFEKKLVEAKLGAQGELADLRRDLEALKQTVAQIEALASTTHRNLAESITALKARLTEMEERFGSREQTIKTQIAAIDEALAALRDAVAQIEALASKTDRNLAESIAALKARLTEMEERFGSREQMIKEQIAAIEGALAALRDAVAALERGLSAVEEKHDALEAEIQALEERVSAMEKTLGESTGGWEVHWYEMVQPGVFGAKLGTSSFPLNFAFDWGYGRVYKLWDRVGFKAYARIHLARDAWHYIKVAANNCFVLYVDGNKVLDHWGVGEALPAEEKELEIWLSAGWHELELHYYEWEEQAWVSFHLK